MTARRILVVDDSALLLDMVRSTLEDAGFDVVTANTLDELEAQDSKTFDLILMDVQMPELYGDDIAAIFRHVRGARARIVLLSNLAPEELAQRSSEAELDGFICKQDGMGVLLDRVQELLS